MRDEVDQPVTGSCKSCTRPTFATYNLEVGLRSPAALPRWRTGSVMLWERYCRGGKSARSLTPTDSGGERARLLIISPRMGHIAERVAFSMGCLLIAGCRLTGGRRRLAAALRVLTGWPLVDGLAAWLPGCLALALALAPGSWLCLCLCLWCSLALGCLAACCLLARSAVVARCSAHLQSLSLSRLVPPYRQSIMPGVRDIR